MVLRLLLVSNDYSSMKLMQRENASLARSLFMTQWGPQNNQCGLLDCKKRCGDWMPSIDRGIDRVFIAPAPACDPPTPVVLYIEQHPGRLIVTCSLTCCRKAWSMLQVVQAAGSYKPSSKRRYYKGVLLTIFKAGRCVSECNDAGQASYKQVH